MEKESKYKNSYLGTVTDFEITTHEQKKPVPAFDFHENPSNEEYNARLKVIEVKQKSYGIRKNRLFCSCGDCFDVEIKYKTKKIDRKVNEWYDNSKVEFAEVEDRDCFETIKCDKCEKEYSNFTNITLMRSKLYDNCISMRYSTFVNEEKIRFVKFKTYVGINQYSKNLFFVEKTQSICYNKKTKRFYINFKTGKNKKTQSVGIRQSNVKFFSFIESALFDKSCFEEKNVTPIIRDIDRDYTSPLNEFIKELTKIIDKRDYQRVVKYVDDNLLKFDNSALNVKHNDYATKNSSNKEIVKFFDALGIIASIIQVPSLSTLLFTKGEKFFAELININTFPRPGLLKKNNPTSPKKIIEEIIKQGFEQWFSQTKRKHNPEGKEFLDKCRKNIRPLIIRQSLNKELNKKSDIEIISFLFSREFDEKFFYNSCDLYGTRKVLDTFNAIFYNDFYGSNNIQFDYKKIKHIIKIHVTPESNSDTSFLFGRRNTNFSLYTYNDTIRMLEALGLDAEDVYKCKTWDEILELHENVYERLKLFKLEKYNESIKIFTKKYEKLNFKEIDGITFKLITNVAGLEKESKDLSHCVRTYAQGVSEGRHLIFSIEDTNDKSRATLEFKSSNEVEKEDVWTFSQLKSKHNSQATKKIIDTVFVFCESVLKKENVKYVISDYSISNGDLRKNNITQEELNDLNGEENLHLF